MQGASGSNENPSGVRGVCPDGWHLPSRAEWRDLAIAAGAGKNLKSTSGWVDTNNDLNGLSGSGTDELGFSALPGGHYNGGGVGEIGDWWTATEYDADDAYYREMNWIMDIVVEDNHNKGDGKSVRCVRDN
jgi:uncharacterized protein (TIGR02145 family)